MKKYKVEVWQEYGGYYYVEAENDEKAEEIAHERLFNGEPYDREAHGSHEVLSVEELTK